MASARQAAQRQEIERQYAAHALATDPLVRLQVIIYVLISRTSEVIY
jgi:hypothetical protein